VVSKLSLYPLLPHLFSLLFGEIDYIYSYARSFFKKTLVLLESADYGLACVFVAGTCTYTWQRYVGYRNVENVITHSRGRQGAYAPIDTRG